MRIEFVYRILSGLDQLLRGIPMIGFLMVAGLFFSFGTKFLQFRKLGTSMHETVGKAFVKGKADTGITPFQALCTALAATIGTGNIAGVAGAIALGGPGAIFWMWVSAFFGMIIKYAEIVLALVFREKQEDSYAGGPMYYIRDGLPKVFLPLAYIFAACGSVAVFGTGNATQINTMTGAVTSFAAKTFHISGNGIFYVSLAVGMVAAFLVGSVMLGGIRRIGSVTEMVVPLMSVVYILLAMGVIFTNTDRIPAVLVLMVKGAFNPASVTGGVVGSVAMTMQIGVSRGIFSNEAGLGTAPMAHACANTDSPARQGLFGIFEVFVDTILICTITAFVILCGNNSITYGVDTGAQLTLQGFANTYGDVANVIMCISLIFFAFASVLGWGVYGTQCIRFLLGEKAVRPFLFVFAGSCVFGATADLRLVWSMAEILNGLMTVPNLTAVLLLYPTVIKETQKWENELHRQKKCAKIANKTTIKRKPVYDK